MLMRYVGLLDVPKIVIIKVVIQQKRKKNI